MALGCCCHVAGVDAGQAASMALLLVTGPGSHTAPHLAHIHNQCLGVLRDRGQVKVPTRNLQEEGTGTGWVSRQTASLLNKLTASSLSGRANPLSPDDLHSLLPRQYRQVLVGHSCSCPNLAAAANSPYPHCLLSHVSPPPLSCSPHRHVTPEHVGCNHARKVDDVLCRAILWRVAQLRLLKVKHSAAHLQQRATWRGGTAAVSTAHTSPQCALL